MTGNTWAIRAAALGSDNGLFEGYKPAFNEGAPRDFAAQIIYNAIFATTITYRDGVAQKVGSDNKDNKTVGERDLNLIQKYAVVGGNDRFAINGSNTVASHQTRLIPSSDIKGNVSDNIKQDYITTSPAISFEANMALLGREVKVLYRDAKTTNSTKTDFYGDPDLNSTIYGITPTGKNTAYDVTKGDLDDADSDRLDLGGDYGKVKVADEVLVYINFRDGASGKDYFTFSVKNADIADNADLALALTTGKNKADKKIYAGFNGLKADSADAIQFVTDNDGKIQYAFVTEKVYAKVSNVSSDKVTFVGGKAIDIDGNDLYSGIAKDDIAAVTVLYKGYTEMDDSDASVIATKVDTVEGTVSALAKDGKKMTLGDTVYSRAEFGGSEATYIQLGTSEDYKLANDDDALASADDLDENFTIYADGKFWFAYLNTAGTVKNYAVVTAADYNNLEARVKILDSEGNEKTYAIDSDSEVKLGVEGTASGSTKTYGYTVGGNSDPLYENVWDSNASGQINAKNSIVGKLFRFTITSSGDIKLKRDNVNYVASSTANFNDTGKLFSSKATSDTAVGFVNYKSQQKSEMDWDTFSVNDMKSYGPSNPVYGYSEYATSGKNVIAFVLSSSTKGKPGSANKASYGFVTKDPEVVTVSGDKYTQVTLWDGTEEVTIKIDDNGDNAKKGGANYVTKRDFVSYNPGSNGIVDSDDFFGMSHKNEDGFFMTAAALYDYKSGRSSMQVYNNVNDEKSTTTGFGVMDNVKVIYVNVDDGKGVSSGTPTASTWDSKKYPLNVVYQFVEDDGQAKVAVIFIDTDNDITVDGSKYTDGRLHTFDPKSDTPSGGGGSSGGGDTGDKVTDTMFSAMTKTSSVEGAEGVDNKNGVIAIEDLSTKTDADVITAIKAMFDGARVTDLDVALSGTRSTAKSAAVSFKVDGEEYTKTYSLVEAFDKDAAFANTKVDATTGETVQKIVDTYGKQPGAKSVVVKDASGNAVADLTTALASGKYTVEVTTETGAVVSKEITVSVTDKPVVAIDPNITISGADKDMVIGAHIVTTAESSDASSPFNGKTAGALYLKVKVPSGTVLNTSAAIGDVTIVQNNVSYTVGMGSSTALVSTGVYEAYSAAAANDSANSGLDLSGAMTVEYKAPGASSFAVSYASDVAGITFNTVTGSLIADSSNPAALSFKVAGLPDYMTEAKITYTVTGTAADGEKTATEALTANATGSITAATTYATGPVEVKITKVEATKVALTFKAPEGYTAAVDSGTAEIAVGTDVTLPAFKVTSAATADNASAATIKFTVDGVAKEETGLSPTANVFKPTVSSIKVSPDGTKAIAIEVTEVVPAKVKITAATVNSVTAHVGSDALASGHVVDVTDGKVTITIKNGDSSKHTVLVLHGTGMYECGELAASSGEATFELPVTSVADITLTIVAQ